MTNKLTPSLFRLLVDINMIKIIKFVIRKGIVWIRPHNPSKIPDNIVHIYLFLFVWHVKNFIKEYRGFSFKYVKPLIISKSYMECYLSKTSNPWPGDLDGVIKKSKDNTVKALLEFTRTANLKWGTNTRWKSTCTINIPNDGQVWSGWRLSGTPTSTISTGRSASMRPGGRPAVLWTGWC